MTTMDQDDDELEQKAAKATKVRRTIIVALVLATCAFWIYTRFVMTKSPLGGPCSWAIQCASEAPRCMKQSAGGAGACSRPCDFASGDCEVGIRCMQVELEERDERGVPLTGGYCYPEALLPPGKKAIVAANPSAEKPDTWLTVPEVKGQLEAEIVYQFEKNGVPVGEKTHWAVKGSLVRVLPESRTPRVVVDTSALRVYNIDDAHASFAGFALAGPGGNVQLSKTDKKDRVAERECELWRLEEDAVVRDVCILQGAAWIDPSVQRVPLWVRELAVRSALPLRVIEHDELGRETSRMVATRLTLRPMDRALFAIPKTYRNQAAR